MFIHSPRQFIYQNTHKNHTQSIKHTPFDIRMSNRMKNIERGKWVQYQLEYNMYNETIFYKIRIKSLLEQFLQDVGLLFVVFAFLAHRSTCWCLTRYAFEIISSNLALLFQCLEHDWDPRMHVGPGSRVFVFLLEPYNLISIRVSFQCLNQSLVM